MKKLSVLVYGVISYLIGFASLLAWILCMLGVLNFQFGLDFYRSDSLTLSFLISLGLTLIFGLQHTVMARASFKKLIPQMIERSTYVLVTGIVLLGVLLFWPMSDVVTWKVESQVVSGLLMAVALCGWAYLFLASFAINHFELFGLEQVYDYFKGKTYHRVPFKERLMYRFDRHPIMTGALIGMWVTPVMRLDHLYFSALITLYIVIGVSFEEEDLESQWRGKYVDYKKRVMSIVPTFHFRH